MCPSSFMRRSTYCWRCRARHARIVNPGVLVEALVLGGQDREFELLRDILDADQQPPFLAELADQRPLRGVDAQRDLRLVIGKYFKRRQVRIGERNDQAREKCTSRRQAREQDERKRQKTKPNQRGYANSRGMLHAAGDTAHYRLVVSWKIH